MQKQILIVIICAVVLGLILFCLGCLIGISFEKQEVSPQLEQLEKTTKTIKGLSSKTIASITVFGEVTNISGRMITVTNGDESIDVSIKEDAQILPLESLAEKNVTPQKKIEFGEIKKGDNLNVNIKVLPTGELEGIIVVVFPPENF